MNDPFITGISSHPNTLISHVAIYAILENIFSIFHLQVWDWENPSRENFKMNYFPSYSCYLKNFFMDVNFVDYNRILPNISTLWACEDNIKLHSFLRHMYFYCCLTIFFHVQGFLFCSFVDLNALDWGIFFRIVHFKHEHLLEVIREFEGTLDLLFFLISL